MIANTMSTIIIYFKDHQPIRVRGDRFTCIMAIANAKLHPGYVSWDQVA